MEYRPLGRSGLKVSVLGLGTNAFGTRADRAVSIALLDRALAAGINLIDTADVYGDGASESIIGEWLGGHRREVVLATKGGLATGAGPNDQGASRAHLVSALEASLRRLRTDHVDLYQLHYPDPSTPLEETMGALDDLVQAGKVRYVGASNHSALELCRALSVSDVGGLTRYISTQSSLYLGNRTVETDLVPFCREMGVGFIAYRPLGAGLLSGKYKLGAPPPPGSRAVTQEGYLETIMEERGLRLAAEIASLAADLGWRPAQLALAWVIESPGVTCAIPGATSVTQLEENLGGAEVRLPMAVRTRLDQVSQPYLTESLGR